MLFFTSTSMPSVLEPGPVASAGHLVVRVA